MKSVEERLADIEQRLKELEAKAANKPPLDAFGNPITPYDASKAPGWKGR